VNISREKEMGEGIWHVCETEAVHAEFWWGNLRERGLGVDGRIILTLMLKRSVVRACNVLVWLTLGTSGGLL
jgi:hypothetical protein